MASRRWARKTNLLPQATLLVLLFLLSACSGDGNSESNASNETTSPEEQDQFDPEGPSPSDLEEGLAARWDPEAGDLVRITSVERDDSAPEGIDYWVVIFEYQQANTTVLRCGAGFGQNLIDEWEISSNIDCQEIQAADLTQFDLPSVELLHEIGCQEYESLSSGQECDLEIVGTSQTVISAGDLVSGELLIDEPVLEVVTDMTRDNWLGDKGPGTCAYVFHFRWTGDDWAHVDDSLLEDVDECSNGDDVTGGLWHGSFSGIRYAGTICRDGIVNDAGRCRTPNEVQLYEQYGWDFAITLEESGGSMTSVLEIGGDTYRVDVLHTDKGLFFAGLSGDWECATFSVTELSSTGIAGEWECGVWTHGVFYASR